MNNYLMVREFTNAVKSAKGLEPCPSKPYAMNAEEVKFLVKMVMSEMAELVDTISESSEDTNRIMLECLGTDPSKHVKYNNASEIIAAQGDAMVDAWYYMCDAACKKGINVSEMFDLVHSANMNKLVDGKAIVREDGKVLKPPGWVEADIVGYVRKCLSDNNDKFLMDKANLNSALSFASAQGSLKSVKLLIEKGADVCYNNNTCIVNASMNGHLEIVKLLIEHGADVKCRNNSSLTNASSYGHLELVKLLLKHGAIVTDEAVKNASSTNRLEIMKELIRYGASVNRALYYTSKADVSKEIIDFIAENAYTE